MSADTASAACPVQSGSLAMTSITFAAVICEADDPCVRGVHSARGPNSNPPGGVAQEGFLIPVIGSGVGVDGGGVEHMEGNGSGTSRSGR